MLQSRLLIAYKNDIEIYYNIPAVNFNVTILIVKKELDALSLCDLQYFFQSGKIAFILWFVSGFKTDEKTITKKVLYPIAIAYMAFGVIEFMHFFPFAASLSLVAGILIAISLMIGK